jgi:hypothetical protein
MTDEQVKEIKQAIETMSVQYTDFVSLIWGALGLDKRPLETKIADDIDELDETGEEV